MRVSKKLAITIVSLLFLSVVTGCLGSNAGTTTQQEATAAAATTAAATTAAATTAAAATTEAATKAETTTTAAATTEAKTAVTTQAAASTVAEQSAKKELDIWMRHAAAGHDYNNAVFTKLEEMSGIKLNITGIPMAELDDKVQMMLAAGEKADIFNIHPDWLEMKLVENGLLYPISKEFANAPQLQSRFADVWPAMVHSNGEIYAIPWMNFIANIDFCLMFRQDWLNLYGLEVPKTIDEYYDFVMMCVNGDPRGDGEKVFAFGGTNGLSDARFQDHIFGAYGALPGEWQLVDGVLTCGTIMDGTKEALKFINKLWNDGAIDPEFITDDWAKCMDKVNRGYYAAISGRTHAFWSSSNYWNLLRENVPDASWVYADPLTSQFTDKPMGPRQLSRRGWLKTVVHAETEKIDTVMKYLDFLATEAAAEVVLCGIEGETFTRNADGTIHNLYGDADAPQWGIAMMTLARWDLASRYTPLYVETMNKIKPTAHPALVDSFVIDEVAEYQADLNEYQSRMLTQFAVGETDIETGWDDFVQEWLRRGGQALGDAYNREYQARN